jgi:uncharacterized protein
MGSCEGRGELPRSRRRFTGCDCRAGDPNQLEDIDTRFAYGEERVQVIGMANQRILFVVMTMRAEDVCHIISARKADRHEQDRYYTGDHEAL